MLQRKTPDISGSNSAKIAVVIPTLNEEETVGKVLIGIQQAMNDYNYHAVIVDGWSIDDTEEIARKHGASVIRQRKEGYGDALKTGFSHAREQLNADIIVMIDADCTYDPKDMPQLVNPLLKNDADLVIGNRLKGMRRGSMPFINRVGNRFLSWFAKITLRLGIHDTQCGFRAFRSKLLDEMLLLDDGMPFATEMLAEAKHAGARIREEPIAYMPRVGGETKLSPLRDGLRILGTILRLLRDSQPLLFFGGLGMLSGLGAAIFGLQILLEWLQTGSLQNLPSLIVFVLLLVGAIQLVSFGLLADMIKRLSGRAAQTRLGNTS